MSIKKAASQIKEVVTQEAYSHTKDIVPHIKRFGQAVLMGTQAGAVTAAILAVSIGRNSTAIIVSGLAIVYLMVIQLIKEERACIGQMIRSQTLRLGTANRKEDRKSGNVSAKSA